MKLTKEQIKFILTATDFIDDKIIKHMTNAKILSRLGALGLGEEIKDK